MTGASTGRGGARGLGREVPALGRTEVWPRSQPAAPVTVGASATSFESFYDREMPRLVALAQALAGIRGGRRPRPGGHDRRVPQVGAGLDVRQPPKRGVRRVCANTAVSLVRRRAAEARALLKLSSRRETPALDAAAETFWDEVRHLPRRQAQATDALRYIYDLPIDDIAQTMGCSAGSVKAHLNRARTTLATRLATTDEEST